MELGLGEVDPAILRAAFNAENLHVSAHWPQGVDYCWDLLMDVDVVPQQVPGGWVCGICRAEKPAPKVTLFSDREALWADHLFEPLLEFVNNRFAKAEALALWGGDGRSSSASLIPPDTAEVDKPTHLVQLRAPNQDVLMAGSRDEHPPPT